jgi:hypothetical protein
LFVNKRRDRAASHAAIDISIDRPLRRLLRSSPFKLPGRYFTDRGLSQRLTTVPFLGESHRAAMWAPTRMGTAFAIAVFCLCGTAEPLVAQAPDDFGHQLSDLEERLTDVERDNAALREKIGQLENPTHTDSPDAPNDGSQGTEGLAANDELPATAVPPWRPRYDRGFILLDPAAVDGKPFQIKANITSEFRYTGFVPTAQTFTNSAGLTLPIDKRSDFELVRNYVQLSGFAFDPKLQYTAIVFGSSAAGATTYVGWINYDFRKEFNLYLGFWKLPGSREWYESYTNTLGADRTMATTFFRPNVTGGIWARGEVLTRLRYVAMIGNSIDSATLNANRMGNDMVYSGTAWWEPLGDFGQGFSDLESHPESVVRMGMSGTFGREIRQSSLSQPFPENTILRLSDGTPLFETGALAPGVTLQATRDYLSAFDLAWKWRGMNISTEYYLRWLNHFVANGALPFGSLFDHGGFVQSGVFVTPKVEAFARSSYVTGHLGTGWECGGGVNWFIYGNRNVRATFEVTRVERSAADNILTGYRAGDSGVLFQAQLLTIF